MSARRVLLYVQHLLGIGHLRRAAALAHGLAAAGLDATLVSGGEPVATVADGARAAGIRWVQLPPASAADLGFQTLLDEHGREVDDRWRESRAAALLDAWRGARPHVLLLELYPFGRRQMRFELLPLLEAAAADACRPFIATSLRDILGGGRSEARRRETLDLLERYFDAVLVHSDRAVVPLESTFPEAGEVAAKLHYTGYVVGAAPRGAVAGAGEVLVSAGGGAVGGRLLETAIRARSRSRLRDRTWRILAGVHLDDAAFAALQDLARECGAGIVLERARADFGVLLANCEVSVSQAGYNTLLESVQARARTVAVPFAGGQETEQSLRARRFAERGLLEVLEESRLTPEALAATVDRAAARPRPAEGALDLGGAARSAELVAQWAESRQW